VVFLLKAIWLIEKANIVPMVRGFLQFHVYIFIHLTIYRFCVVVSRYRKPPLNQPLRSITHCPHSDVLFFFILLITPSYSYLPNFYLSIYLLFLPLLFFPRVLTINDDIFFFFFFRHSRVHMFILHLMIFLSILIPYLVFSFISYTTYNLGKNGLWGFGVWS